jgi:UDP-GlcNAc3NAcA epimerase
MKKILAIIGARPQFIKHATVDIASIGLFDLITLHTGQHYDTEMSEIFFEELGIRKPKYLLNIGSGTHAYQTGIMLQEIEQILLNENPIAVIVYGDTNSTLAGSLAASKLGIKVIHIEAGLRSYNKSMPEEINRILTDHISDLLFVPSDTAINNLIKENIKRNVYRTGDVMCDLLLKIKNKLNHKTPIEPYYYATLHRPYNVDNSIRLFKILNTFQNLKHRVFFSMHPRTLRQLQKNKTNMNQFSNITFSQPLSYIQNAEKLINCEALLTDSGGMQKEAYILKKKCITIRSETEWVETLDYGWNSLVFEDLEKIPQLLNLKPGTHNPVLYGNGNTAKEICIIILNYISKL